MIRSSAGHSNDISGSSVRIPKAPVWSTVISIRWTDPFCSGWPWEFAFGSELGCFVVERSSASLGEPLVTIRSVVADSLLVLLEKPRAVHGTKLANEDGSGFLIEFGGEFHGSEMMSMGLRVDTIK